MKLTLSQVGSAGQKAQFAVNLYNHSSPYFWREKTEYSQISTIEVQETLGTKRQASSA